MTVERAPARTYRWCCGHCGDHVADSAMFVHPPHDGESIEPTSVFLVCPACSKGTVRVLGKTFPPALVADEIGGLSPEIAVSWEEARIANAAGAYTAAVLVCRKILMHMACEKAGAEAGQTFQAYITALVDSGELPRSHKKLLHEVRETGNKGAHVLESVDAAESERTLRLTAACLRNLYEIPNAS